MERKVNVLFLDKGMFIVRLSRPWIDTPFWIQGFLVRSDHELDALRKYCEWAYIDTLRGQGAEFYMEEDMELPSNPRLEKDVVKKQPPPRPAPTRTLKAGLVGAVRALELGRSIYQQLIGEVIDTGQVDMARVHELVDPIIACCREQTDAITLLTQLRNRHDYLQSHAINSCVFAAAFGLSLGLNSDELFTLAAGVLLIDIGNVRVPPKTLYKEGALDDIELREVRKHVYYSYQLLKDSKDVPEDMVNIAFTHHERFDGSGYPNGLSGVHSPVYGRIAALIDCFDAMIRQRGHSDRMTPHGALQEIYRWRGKLFQAELVDLFMQAMGTYPNGSLVELNSGDRGLVVAQHPQQKLKPIILLLNEKQAAGTEPRLLDMAGAGETAQGKPLQIIRDLTADDCGVNMDQLYTGLNNLLPERMPKPASGHWLAKLLRWLGMG